jgi:hypothetical protein
MRGEGRARRGRRRGRRGGRNRDGGQPSNAIGGEPQADFAGGREASAEEREFHAQQSNGSRGDPAPSHESTPRESAPAERSDAPPRESRNEGTQAPLDLPPPPPSKPFVVWSSVPGDDGGPRRDE